MRDGMDGVVTRMKERGGRRGNGEERWWVDKATTGWYH
jgi:hypothetical protein